MNVQNLAQMFQTMSMMQNPKEIVMQKLGLPPGANMNDPNAILQMMVKSGRISQGDVDALMSLKDNPMFTSMMQKMLHK